MKIASTYLKALTALRSSSDLAGIRLIHDHSTNAQIMRVVLLESEEA